MEPILISLGERLRALRERRGETIAAVAEVLRWDYQVKVDGSYLSRIERGKLEPTARTLTALAFHYGTSLSSLLGDPEMFPDASGLLSDPVIRDLIDQLRQLLGPEKAMEVVLDALEAKVDLAESLALRLE